MNGTVQLLSSDETWRRGFECGVVYALMMGQCPRIVGAYESCNEEQLFALAHQFGYTFTWVPLGQEKTYIDFARTQDSSDSE